MEILFAVPAVCRFLDNGVLYHISFHALMLPTPAFADRYHLLSSSTSGAFSFQSTEGTQATHGNRGTEFLVFRKEELANSLSWMAVVLESQMCRHHFHGQLQRSPGGQSCAGDLRRYPVVFGTMSQGNLPLSWHHLHSIHTRFLTSSRINAPWRKLLLRCVQQDRNGPCTLSRRAIAVQRKCLHLCSRIRHLTSIGFCTNGVVTSPELISMDHAKTFCQVTRPTFPVWLGTLLAAMFDVKTMYAFWD